MMKTKPLSLYIHIPFCLARCAYCDFCSFVGVKEDVKRQYVDQLLAELSAYGDVLREYHIETIFFGGGTPSLLPHGEVERLLTAIFAKIEVAKDAEISMEVNPATVTRESLTALKEAGINRLSIGVQSFVDTELRALSRLHSAEEAKSCVRMAKEVGFDSVSLDLMYAIPHQTQESFALTLRTAVSLAPDHISAYALKVEEGTPFYRDRDSLPLPDEDGEVGMYDLCHEILTANGYTQYEVSNYAKEGKCCRHNLTYWMEREYIGLGVAAHSYFGGYRYGTDRDFEGYLTRAFDGVPHGEAIHEETEVYEAIMLGLRLQEGIREEAFYKRFGQSFYRTYKERLAPYVAAGLVVCEPTHTALTHRGMYVMNSILAVILADS